VFRNWNKSGAKMTKTTMSAIGRNEKLLKLSVESTESALSTADTDRAATSNPTPGPDVAADPLSKVRERLLSRIAPPNSNGCALWTGGIASSGYGAVKIFGRRWSAHRAVWTVFSGPITDGLCVLHKCDVRACVNIEHLFLGTLADNIADMDRKGRRNPPMPWPLGPVGIDAPQTKLTESNVIEIFRRQYDGESYRSLAREFGVGKSTIWQIVAGKKWRHLGLRREAFQ
jgi:hypothetical protein